MRTSLPATYRWVCLLLILSTVAACVNAPAPTVVSILSSPVPSSGEETVTGLAPSPTPSPSPSPSPILTALSTVPAPTDLPPLDGGGTGGAGTDTLPPSPTYTPSVTPTQPAPTVTGGPVPSATGGPVGSASEPMSTPAPTATPVPAMPAGAITPTHTITPTLTPTLTPTPAFSPTPLPTPAYSGKMVHFLLIGLDSTQNLKSQNTDVIMVAALNKDTGQVSLLSIPRDLWVYIPTYGWSRINVAHKTGERMNYPGGGPALLKRTIEMNFGIPIDHWGRVDYQGFTKVVDKLGGVDMIVPCRVNLRYLPPTKAEETELILEPGVHHMDGYTALHYVRTRRDTSDFDRARRQQQFLRAMWAQAKSRGILAKIPGLWAALRNSFETDMTLLDVVSLAPTALEIKPQHVRSRYIGPHEVKNWVNADGWQVLLPDYAKIQEVVAGLYAPPAASQDQAVAEAARIQVRNGTGRPQLALIAADQLRWQGLNIVDTAPAERADYKKTQILVFNDRPKAVELLAQLLQVKPQNIIRQPDPSQPADIQVILGEDYDSCREF